MYHLYATNYKWYLQSEVENKYAIGNLNFDLLDTTYIIPYNSYLFLSIGPGPVKLSTTFTSNPGVALALNGCLSW